MTPRGVFLSGGAISGILRRHLRQAPPGRLQQGPFGRGEFNSLCSPDVNRHTARRELQPTRRSNYRITNTHTRGRYYRRALFPKFPYVNANQNTQATVTIVSYQVPGVTQGKISGKLNFTYLARKMGKLEKKHANTNPDTRGKCGQRKVRTKSFMIITALTLLLILEIATALPSITPATIDITTTATINIINTLNTTTSFH